LTLAGTIEKPIEWGQGVGKLKLKEHVKPLCIQEALKILMPKGLGPGDQIQAEVREGQHYFFVNGLERAASPEQTSGSAIYDTKPPVEPPPTKSEDFNIPYSYKRIGPLYPILVDREGNVIDGKHRLAIDPNWRKEVVPWVQSRKDLLMARIHANLHRRTVPVEERRTEFTEYANILHADGVAIGELAAKISELTGFAETYVRELLPRSLKSWEKQQAGRLGGEARAATFNVARGVTSPQSTTLPDIKVDLEEAAMKRGEIAAGAPAQTASDLYTGPCPFCGQVIRWDEERKIFAKPA
jgi:hypothetical protein